MMVGCGKVCAKWGWEWTCQIVSKKSVPPVTLSQPLHWPYRAATLISLPSPSQNKMGCRVQSLGVKTKTKAHWLGEELSGSSPSVSFLKSPPPQLPPPTTIKCDRARECGKPARSGRRWCPWPQTPASRDYAFQECQVMPTLTPTCPDLGECSPPPRLG